MILVTGATGLLGSYLLLELLQQDEPVRAIIYNPESKHKVYRMFKSTGANLRLLEKVEWVQGDILDYFSLLDAMKGVEKVYHCAGYVSFSPFDKEKLEKINIEGTANVVNAALESGVRKLAYSSSVAALGRTEDTLVIDENSQFKTSKLNSHYALSKFAAEWEVWRGSAEGLEVVIVNPSIIFGYGDPSSGSTKMFGTLHKHHHFYGKGSTGFVGAGDVARIMVILMESDIINERFLVSAGDFSYQQVFSWIAQGFGKTAPRFAIPNWVLGAVWRLEWILARINPRHQPMITRETARTSLNNLSFSSKKLLTAIDFEYTPLPEVITKVCQAMLPELENKN
ncbi:MAG: NAD-dependent epimerase/dehydratase family protein [Lentimicrobium sp.]|jgi:nucleoside-diphosphate-sugar epimerase|nr:NAD-dependent epimerase/dehydratase family protein [Lentimicrobium sp.]MDD4598380.1 NAD-dependent epimerase/dehydratase family protein [Lentimicrobiaceae bacterium]MDY0025591.1 NAD-dependent epimerase/dehydratase family protein [Lentimicrobium sp.]HAH59514.1 3-beta hydroxysteroid dehydrogenase [Bacteroidales bacterium]